MKTNTKPLDIRDFLQSDEEITEYINEAFQDVDPRVFLIALGNVVRAKGVSQVAKETGLGRESLYKIFSGAASPRWATLKRLLDNLDIQLTLHSQSKAHVKSTSAL